VPCSGLWRSAVSLARAGETRGKRRPRARPIRLRVCCVLPLPRRPCAPRGIRLREFLDPIRTSSMPGHAFGFELSPAERDALVHELEQW
jgi:hypothetical protein